MSPAVATQRHQGERRSSGSGAAALGPHIAAGRDAEIYAGGDPISECANILLFPIEAIYCTRVFCNAPVVPVS
jgi:hypothetical protein